MGFTCLPEKSIELIITRIIGGLGNQLFQYAAARALSIHNNVQLKLDVSSYSDYTLRSFELEKFYVKAEPATRSEIDQLVPGNFFSKSLQYILPPRQKTYFRERKFSFYKNYFSLGPNVYLKGYFQSEEYFNRFADQINSDIKWKGKLSAKAGEIETQIRNCTSICIHIRRGDFESNSKTTSYHGLLSADYYNDAINFFQERFSKSSFFIFSDDLGWAKSNIQSKGYLIDLNDPLETFQLMRSCRHHIIANSSFSWWGAWLNPNPDKIVIAPKNWFNKGPKDTQDLIPKGWIRL